MSDENPSEEEKSSELHTVSTGGLKRAVNPSIPY
jgi:hypothetical protein